MVKKSKGKKKKKKKQIIEDNKPKAPEGCMSLLFTMKQMEEKGIL